MGSGPQVPGRGRLVLVTGTDAAHASAVGRAVASRLDLSLVVPVDTLAAMVVAQTPRNGPSVMEEVRRLLLAWSASLAVAETYQLEGYDVVVTDSVLGEHLEDFLDLVAPEPLHLVVLGSVRSSGADPSPVTQLLRATPRRGLWLEPAERSPDDLAEVVLARLGESLVTED
ncbi:MAG: hypothetical protein ABIS35_14470 [Terracoccus sp.]